MNTLVRHIWNNKDPKEYAKYESTIIRLLNELDKDCTRHDRRMKFRTVQKQFLKSLDKYKTILLYLKDDEVVGLTLMIVSEGLISTMSISDLIVDSKYRNKGYGSYILEDSINYAKERKFKNVCLQVFTNNIVARNMYLKRGFKPVTEFMMLGLESMNTINKDTYILEIGNEGIIDKILDTLLPDRSKKFVQATPEEKKERKERIDSFIKCHQHVIKDFPKEFISTFAIYANDEGIVEYPENKALQYCVVFHATGHESIFEKYISSYRKALIAYVKEKSQGKYTAKVDDLSQSGPHNLGVFVLMIPLKNKAKNNKSGNESLYQYSLSQYEQFLKYDFDTVALESFGSSITRFITSILDTILKLLNNFKATVLGTFKDLKRTELQEFEDSNKISLSRVLKYPYEFLASNNVVVPKGMIKPYKVTTEKIKGCLDTLDMVNRSEKALASVDNVLNMLMSNTKLQVKQDTINIGELRSLEQIFKQENACFSPFRRCEELPFSKVFESDHCLKDTYELLSNTVIYEQDVSKVYNTLERIYQKFEQILRLIESDQVNVTKSDLLMLSGQTTTLAKLFDMYGVVISDLQRVEHNFVIVLKNIQEKYGL